MARRRFFVDEVRDGTAELTGEEARHLTRVLRVEPGQQFEISDNRTTPYLAEILHTAKDRIVFRVPEPIAPRLPPVAVALYPALFKFDRFEWMLEKATELGVTAVIPVEAGRSEKGLREAAAKRLERWRRIARESSQQSRRDRLPDIHPPAALATCLAGPADYRYYLEEEPGAPPLAAVLPAAACRLPTDSTAVLVGPEGGWTTRERELAAAAGWTAVSLGQQILRAETAALAAISVLTGTWQVRQPG